MNGSNYSKPNLGSYLQQALFQRSLLFGGLIVIALLAFEVFNYSTTDYALGDLLGDLTFLGIRWATILAIAFCGIDFAGIARLFTPQQGRDEPAEVWYLFGAWLLAAGMNTTLTWWGVSLAIINHDMLGNAIIDRTTLTKIVPIFVAVMVWLIRVLIIGTFSVAGEQLFGAARRESRQEYQRSPNASNYNYRQINDRPAQARETYNRPPVNQPLVRPASSLVASAFRPAPKPNEPDEDESTYGRGEPTYHPLAAKPANPGNAGQVRR